MKKRNQKGPNMAAKFNEMFTPGDTILFRSVAHKSHPFIPHVLAGVAFVASSGEPAAFLAGRSGYVSIMPDFIDYQASRIANTGLSDLGYTLKVEMTPSGALVGQVKERPEVVATGGTLEGLVENIKDALGLVDSGK